MNRTEKIQYIRQTLPAAELLAQLAEDCSELAQAALKLRRVYDGTNPTPKPSQEAFADIEEEIADVSLCLQVLGFELGLDEYEEMITRKLDRWGFRLREARGEVDADGES